MFYQCDPLKMIATRLHTTNMDSLPVETHKEIVQLTCTISLQALRLTNKYFYNLVAPRRVDFLKFGATHGFLKYCAVGLNRGESTRYTCMLAANYGHLEVLQWAVSQGCPLNKWTCTYAASSGHLEILRWARSQNCPWDEWTCAFAAQNGHLEVLKWARGVSDSSALVQSENAVCPWSEDTCAWAAEKGRLGILRWAVSHGCPWDSRVCSSAALGGHLEVLKWARGVLDFPTSGQSGETTLIQSENAVCPWDEWTCKYAGSNGHLEVLRWAYENECPWNPALSDISYYPNNTQDYARSLRG